MILYHKYRVVQKKYYWRQLDPFVVNSNFCEPLCIKNKRTYNYVARVCVCVCVFFH